MILPNEEGARVGIRETKAKYNLNCSIAKYGTETVLKAVIHHTCTRPTLRSFHPVFRKELGY